MSGFFLDRPVFAWVIAIAMMLAGALAIYNLPISQYPPIAPPSIWITRHLPRRVGRDRRGQRRPDDRDEDDRPRPDALHALHGRLVGQRAMSSSPSRPAPTRTSPGPRCRTSSSSPCRRCRTWCRRAGSRSTSRPATTWSSSASPPRTGAWTRPTSTTTPCRRSSPLSRVPGVGEVQVFGSGYSMRIWLDPDRLTKYGMTSDDVVAAVRAYNVEVSAGQLGGAARGARPAPQRLHPRPVAAGDPGGVRGRPPAHQPGRVGGPRAGHRSRRARYRAARHAGPLQRPGRRPASPSARRRGPTPSTPPTGSRPRWRSSSRLLPARDEGRSTRSTRRRSSRSPSTRW